MKCRELDMKDDIASQLLAQYISSKHDYNVSTVGFWLLEILEEHGPMKKEHFIKELLQENPALRYAWVVSYQRLTENGLIEEEDNTVNITDSGRRILDECRKYMNDIVAAKERDSFLRLL